MLRSALLIAVSSLISCAGLNIDPPPKYVQYGVHADISPSGFYGVDSQTSERVFRQFDDPAMKGAQCLSAADYMNVQAYITYLRQEAQRRCQ
ncbi:MAG: hypothetical protein AB7G93_09470 [Bdellovibrionales bacterium]